MRLLTSNFNKIKTMDKSKEILEQMPNVKIGLDSFYGQTTVLNALNKALNIPPVSDQRELLIGFHKWFLKTHHWSEPMYEQDIDDYLSSL